MLCKLFFGIIVLTIVNIDLDTSDLTDHINDCVIDLDTSGLTNHINKCVDKLTTRETI